MIRVALALLLLAAAPAWAQRDGVPRFASLRADEVNVRAGPGSQYPIEWVLRRRSLPVEIVAEFELWRRIRDPQGAEGWVHQRMLTGRRRVVVTGGLRTLRRRPATEGAPVARLEAGVVADLLECREAWCRIDADGYRGWLLRNEVWGVYTDEAVR